MFLLSVRHATKQVNRHRAKTAVTDAQLCLDMQLQARLNQNRHHQQAHLQILHAK